MTSSSEIAAVIVIRSETEFFAKITRKMIHPRKLQNMKKTITVAVIKTEGMTWDISLLNECNNVFINLVYSSWPQMTLSYLSVTLYGVLG